MSRDFFKVSSILQAVKRAAPAASWTLSAQYRQERPESSSRRTHHVAVLSIGMNEAELVIVDHSRIVRPYGSVKPFYSQ
jgi:hypothetical protein